MKRQGTDAEAIVDLLVGSNALAAPSAWQTPEETTFGTDYSDLLGKQLQKTESESTADVRTDYNKWSRNTTLLLIDAYRKYEPLNLPTVLSVRLLARVPTALTVLAVPVLELELVFARTLTEQLTNTMQSSTKKVELTDASNAL